MTEEKKRAAVRLRRLKADVLGTWSALRAATAGGYDHFQRFEGFQPKAEIAPVISPRVLDERAVLEDHPRIDIRFLDLPQDLPATSLLERRLVYDGWAILFRLEADSDDDFAQVRFYKDGVLTEQLVSITTREIGARRRHVFLCPVLQKPVEILAYRDGLFASAKAQRLVHRSQVGANRKRGLRKKKPTKAIRKKRSRSAKQAPAKVRLTTGKSPPDKNDVGGAPLDILDFIFKGKLR